MRLRAPDILVLLLAAAAGFAGPAVAQEKQPIPYRMLSEHKDTITRLNSLVRQRGAVGTAAQHVLAVMVPHDQREEEFVLPLLGLMQSAASGRIGPEMAWAVPMSDRVVAESDKLYGEHTAIINALNELAAAGRARHNAGLVAFAEEIAADEVDDGSFVYPAAILVGKIVREKLGPK